MIRRLSGLTSLGDRRLVDLLVDQLRTATEAAELAREMVNTEIDRSAARVAMADIEHRGDDQRGALIDAMRDSLVTPIDREDLFRVSRMIDDVIDALRDFVRQFDLFALDQQPGFAPLLEAAMESIEGLVTAVGGLADRRGSVTDACLVAKKSANLVRRLYQEELARRLVSGSTTERLVARELLRQLDIIGVCLVSAADALADGLTKRGQ